MTDHEAVIPMHLQAGRTLTHSLLAERLWSLLEDPWTVFDDVSPLLLLRAGLIALVSRGIVKADRAHTYRLTAAGHEALRGCRPRGS